MNRSIHDNTPILYSKTYFEFIHLCKCVQYYDYSFVLSVSSQLCNLILMCSMICIRFVNNSFQGLLIKGKPFLFAYQCLVQQHMANSYTIMSTILSYCQLTLNVVLAMTHATKLEQTFTSEHHTLSIT